MVCHRFLKNTSIVSLILKNMEMPVFILVFFQETIFKLNIVIHEKEEIHLSKQMRLLKSILSHVAVQLFFYYFHCIY